ncbi:MAG: VCBS repeat-containing protein [Ignavibacteriaceae bacterium]|nr:VCBS repeat-containing protein [Ignavibacteriaceae bacterium]
MGAFDLTHNNKIKICADDNRHKLLAKAFYTAFVILSVLLYSCEESVDPPEESYGKLEGRILNQTDSFPLAGVMFSTRPLTDSAFSDSSGVFLINYIKPGTYSLYANKFSFQIDSTTFSIKAGETKKTLLYAKEIFQINSFLITGKKITALDRLNKKLFDYTAKSEFTVAIIQDINGDGLNELIAGTHRDGADKGVVYVFNKSGAVLWQYKTSQNLWSTGDDMFVYSIRAGDVNGDGKQEVVTLSGHYNWFPERLCVLSASTGILMGSYGNAGRASSENSLLLFDFDNFGGEEIIVGSGNNNLGNSAVVYCFLGSNVSGYSYPETNGSHIWYTDLGQPASGSYPYVTWLEIVVDRNGDGFKDIKCGGGTKTSPTYIRYLSGVSGQVIN